MSTKLTYFDFDGSRGLECRLALTLAGVEFEDNRIQFPQWGGLKPETPFGALPMLEQDGQTLAQSNAILGFVGRLHGLHPSDPARAAQHESLMLGVEDLRHKMPGGKHLSDEDKKEQREAFAAGFLAQFARSAAEMIQGPFLEGDTLSVADLKLYVITRAYFSGTYDHIPADALDVQPKLRAHHAAVDAHPSIAAYWASRPG